MTKFEQWWRDEGSAAPSGGDDFEEHCKKMCAIAWANGAYVEREECAKACEEEKDIDGISTAKAFAEIIRARGK